MKLSTEEQMLKVLGDELKFLGLHSEEVIPGVRKALKNGDHHFAYSKRRMKAGDVTDYSVAFPLEGNSTRIGPECYRASVRQTPPLVHTVAMGIDTAALENELSTLPWHKYNANSGLHELRTPEIYEVADKVKTLMSSSDPTAELIGNQLAARYWLATPMEVLLDLSVPKALFERSLEFQVEELQTAIPAAKARNLLLGRSAATLSEELQPVWAYIDFEAGEKKQLVYTSDFSIGKLLANLSINELEHVQEVLTLIHGLCEGDRMAVHAKGHDDPPPLYLEANAREKGLILFDGSGNRIPLEELKATERVLCKIDIPDNSPPAAQQKKGGPRP